MAKKNSLKFIFDSPVVLVFSVVSAVIFISDLILKLNLSEKIFECPGAKSVPAFDFKSALSYVKLVIYPFGGENSTSFFLNIGFILLLGPVLEERYGSIMLALMIFITSLVGGVLTACVSTFGISGCGGIVFMMIILSVLSVFIKKQLPVSWIFIFALYLAFSLFSGKKISGFMNEITDCPEPSSILEKTDFISARSEGTASGISSKRYFFISLSLSLK